MPTIWVVVPCYGDVPSFLRLRTEVLGVIGSAPRLAGWDVSFVVVDDTAGQDPEISDLDVFTDVEVIEPPFNLGHQRGLVFGVRLLAPSVAPDDVVVTLDADGEDRPVDLPRLIEPVIDAPAHSGTVALASRTSRQESLGFKVYYLLFRIAFRLLTGTVIRSGNFAAYRGSVAQRLLQHPHFDLCYSSSFVSLDAPIVFVPCPRGSRHEGRSRMNRSRLMLHGLRMLMPFIDRIALRALVCLTAVVTASIALFAGLAATWAFTNQSIAPWLLWLSLSLFVGSVVGVGCFIALFASFSQSRGISLSDLEEMGGRGTRSSPAPSS